MLPVVTELLPLAKSVSSRLGRICYRSYRSYSCFMFNKLKIIISIKRVGCGNSNCYGNFGNNSDIS